VRIIGGDLRGRRLKAPPGISTRPTADRVREAIFNVLAPRIRGAAFLDAYAGTGAIGIEALSRGASSCVFVESGAVASRTLAENLAALGLRGKSDSISLPFARAARELAQAARFFDIIYLDPPYAAGEVLEALRACASDGILAESGLLVAEHDATRSLPEREGGLRKGRTLEYGGTSLSLYSHG